MLQVGQKAVLRRRITQEDIEAFVGLTGDKNPLHTDPAFAARSRFGRRVAPGLLTASLIGAVLGSQLPGPGTIYLEQQLRFLRPVYPGDEVEAEVEVIEYIRERGLATLKTTCRNQNGETVVEGLARVLAP